MKQPVISDYILHTIPTELLQLLSQNYWPNCFPCTHRSSKGSSQPPLHPYSPLPKDTDPTNQPADHYAYLRLLGILLFLTKSRPDIMAAVSFAGTRSSNPTDRDLRDLYYVVEYHNILHKSTTHALRIYCEVDASYLLHSDSKGHSGYTISFRAHSTIVALNKPPSPPPPHTPKPEQFSHSPRN